MNKEDKNILKRIGIAFLTWRIGLILIAFIGTKFFPFREGYLGGGTQVYLKNPLIWGWANFDGVHYLTIARQGYLGFQQAFFPLYPFAIRYLAPVAKNYLMAGLSVSHLAFFISLFLFYKLIRLDFKKDIAKRSLLYLLLFPTSFYFGSVYTESLFLALVLGSFYAARKKQWALAGILGAFASATRFVGIFLFPALVIEWWEQTSAPRLIDRHQILNKAKEFLPLFLITLGLAFYMWYLKKTVGDPLYFVHVQPFFGAGRTGGKIILLYQVLWRYLKMLVTVEKMTPTYFVVVLEFLSGLVFLVLSVFAYLRRWFSYVTFMALAYIAPTLTGTLSSMPRYVLVLFPGFILLAIWAEKYKWIRILYPLIAIPLLIISLLFFTRGYWVA